MVDAVKSCGHPAVAMEFEYFLYMMLDEDRISYEGFVSGMRSCTPLTVNPETDNTIIETQRVPFHKGGNHSVSSNITLAPILLNIWAITIVFVLVSHFRLMQ